MIKVLTDGSVSEQVMCAYANVQMQFIIKMMELDEKIKTTHNESFFSKQKEDLTQAFKSIARSLGLTATVCNA